jgi:VTC domain
VESSTAEHIVAGLPPIGLGDLGSAALLNRVDAKFVVHRALLGQWLERCAHGFHALELNGQRDGRYRTTYFDSANLDLYRAHLTGRAVRRKLRVRSYVDTDASFLEIKCRDHGGRTTKSRVAVGSNHATALDALPALPTELTEGLTNVPLHAVLCTNFSRVTLVDTVRAERVTIDSGITFQSEHDARVFPSLVCIEVKQVRRGISPALTALHALGQRATRFSKYCVGVCCMVPGVPTHRFKPVLQQLYRLERDASV